MSQHTGSHKNSLNLLGEKYLNESHWPMRRIRLLECSRRSGADNPRGQIFYVNRTGHFAHLLQVSKNSF